MTLAVITLYYEKSRTSFIKKSQQLIAVKWGKMIGGALERSLLIKVLMNLSMWNPQAQSRYCKNVVFMENLFEFVVDRQL